MKKVRAKAFAAITMLGALAIVANADAADHGDSPAAGSSAGADITDVYAWMDSTTKMNLIMNVVGTTFSDSVQYVFHVESGAGYGNVGNEVNVICQFDANQMIECWAGDDYVKGDASDPVGLASQKGKFKVFAGPRNDPFYFNIGGFNAVIDTVMMAAGGLTFDNAGCPALDANTSTALVTQLATNPGGDAATDDFAGMTVGSIVIQIDKDLVAASGDTVAVWASTHNR